jgi:hypothetical protein
VLAPAGAVAACTITVTEECGEFNGVPFYGVRITVAGFQPNGELPGSITLPNGQTFEGSLELDPSGGGSTSFTSPIPGVFTVRAFTDPPFEQSLNVTCKPKPQSKAECKHNGWRAFGVFKNQGDCVSFVATGGRNQPANPPT